MLPLCSCHILLLFLKQVLGYIFKRLLLSPFCSQSTQPLLEDYYYYSFFNHLE